MTEEKVQAATMELANQKAELRSTRREMCWFAKEYSMADKKAKEEKARGEALEQELSKAKALVTVAKRRVAKLEERLAKAERCNTMTDEIVNETVNVYLTLGAFQAKMNEYASNGFLQGFEECQAPA